MKRAIAALALLAGWMPDLGSAQTQRMTFGLGNVREPTAACGSKGYCQFLNYVGPATPGNPPTCPAGTLYTEIGCATRGPDRFISSGLFLQNSPSYPYYPQKGAFTIELDTATQQVAIVSNPGGTPSGHVNDTLLDIDLGFDSFLMSFAVRFDYMGGTGVRVVEAGRERIDWNNPLPYHIAGCSSCVSGSGSGCGIVGMAPPPPLDEGAPVCDEYIQPGDPHLRDMPDWITKDGWQTWSFPENGDGVWTAGESVVADSQDIGTYNNGTPWIYFGFRNRECGTMNDPQSDSFHPNLGKPDDDCDGNADYTYGLGGIDEPACDDTTRWCTATTTECSFDADCISGPGGTCDVLPEKVCSATSTPCFIDSDCTAPATCVSLGTSLCTNSARSCSTDADCTAPALCKPTRTPIPTSDGDYVCRPIVDCGGPHTPGTACAPGCYENPTRPSLCQKLDRSLVQRSSALALMFDPEHDHFPTRGTLRIVEDMDASETKWCSGGSAIPGSQKRTPRKLCSSATDCAAGETCDPAGTKRWCSGTSTPCTADEQCGFGSRCAAVGTVYIPRGSNSGWNDSSVIVATVPLLDTFVITTAARTLLDGAVGHGSPTDVIVWNGTDPTAGLSGPYKTGPFTNAIGGCSFCQGYLRGTCPYILFEDRLTTCSEVPPGDPQVREYPEWISYDKGQTFQHRYLNGRPGDPNPGHIEAVIESFQGLVETSLSVNRGPVVLFGQLHRECGTMNHPNGGNTEIYEFCSLEDEYCEVDGDCPQIHAFCDQYLGKCDTAAQQPCATDADCPLVAQTCSRAAGNAFNSRSGKPDRDCDRKVDPGVFPIPSDPGDVEFPADLPLPPDLVQDVCISYAQTADTDTQGNRHGNQCRCGDQNRDGRVNVSDLVAINLAIFTPALRTPFCDTNDDGLCNVTDLVGANLEIYSAGTTATCVYNRLPSNP